MKKLLTTLCLALTVVAAPAWSAINVNKASEQALAAELTGVGKALAQAIVAEREANGPYASLEDLDKRVKGVGKVTIEKNQDKILFKD